MGLRAAILKGLLLAFPLFIATISHVGLLQANATSYEVWVLDQGLNKLIILDGNHLSGNGYSGAMEEIDLSSFGGTKPHMIFFSPTGSHAIVANVGNGFVYVIRASDRTVVYAVDTGLQAHAAMPSPDGKRIIVANQNDKKLTEIVADFSTETFSIGRVLDLLPHQDEGHPDVAPICPVFAGDGKRVYTTLRGGGLFIVDVDSMAIVKKFDNVEVAPNGCGGIVNETATKMYVNSGSATSGFLYVFDTATDTLVKTLELTGIYGNDSHGALLTKHRRYVWVGNRLDDNAIVVDTSNDEIVGIIPFIGDAPDLMDVSPQW